MVEPSSTVIETKDIPAAYCNQASVSMSLNDIRVFLSEAIPKTIDVGGPESGPKLQETLFRPVVSLILSPEFANKLAIALTGMVGKYQETFGALRADPPQDAILKSVEPKK